MTARLLARGLSKRFGASMALEDVSLVVEVGSVHALVGQNGAGKSTLLGILAGAGKPDAGVMELDGSTFAPRSPAEARRAGVVIVPQDPGIVPELSVEANVMLGVERSLLGCVRGRRNAALAGAALARLGQGALDLALPGRELRLVQRHVVAIARALVMEARVVVLDEPTSALAAEDTAHVLACIRELAAQGVAVVYVTHFLEEVSRVADTWTALRAGRAVASGSARGSSVDDLVRHFAGGGSPPRAAPREMDAGAVGLHVSGLSGRVSPRGIDLFVPRGEVLGLFGLAGSGRSACLRTILGADERASGSVRVGDGAELAQGARAGVRGGLGLLPEDRVASAFRNASVQDHVTIARLDPLSRFGVLDTTRLAQATRAALDAVRAPHVDPHGALDELSGGMQQRVLLARLVHQAPDVFLLDEPTRGVDVAARRDIHDLVRELAGRGHTLLIASSSEEELLTVCDTIAVMRRGRIVESRAASHWTRGDLLRIASSDGEAA